MKSKHTPTPWNIFPQDDFGQYKFGNPYSQHKLGNIAGQTHHKANAALIVRAVNAHEDLLEALKDAQAVIHQLAEEGRFFDDRNRQQGLEGKINQAIAKAEGK